MSRVLKKPAAVRDLIANGRHIAKDSLSAAERFLDAAERYFRRVGATSRDRASAPFPTPPWFALLVRGRFRQLPDFLPPHC